MLSLSFHAIVRKLQMSNEYNQMMDNELVNICRIIFLGKEMLLFCWCGKLSSIFFLCLNIWLFLLLFELYI